MIEKLLPLTENKLKILKIIYEAGETHLLDISRNLSIHPFSIQKTLISLKFIEKRKSGKTIVLSIDKKSKDAMDLLYIIEDYKAGSAGRKTAQIINSIQTIFSGNRDILTCVLFGSYAREAATSGSDVDLFFVVTGGEKEILKSCRDVSAVIGIEINPIILKENEFFSALRTKEPTLLSMLVPSQRLILLGKEYFLKNSVKIMTNAFAT